MAWISTCNVCGTDRDKEVYVNCPECADIAAMHPRIFHWVCKVLAQADYNAQGRVSYHNKIQKHTANDHYNGAPMAL